MVVVVVWCLLNGALGCRTLSGLTIDSAMWLENAMESILRSEELEYPYKCDFELELLLSLLLSSRRIVCSVQRNGEFLNFNVEVELKVAVRSAPAQ